MSRQTQTPDAREPITSGIRSNIVDIVKGIAIILVVSGHTAQGMVHRGWWASSGAAFSETFIYSFHMPAFFFVAGLFVMGSIAKRGNKHFAVEKLKTILYPYVLFAIIGVALEPLIGRFKSGTQPFHWNIFLHESGGWRGELVLIRSVRLPDAGAGDGTGSGVVAFCGCGPGGIDAAFRAANYQRRTA